MVDHVNFPYRSSGHLALMHVISESGAWERQGLDVNYDYKIGRDEAHELIPTGELEFVSGNHVSTYAARARGDNWVYLGQTISRNNMSLVTREDAGIDKIEDVRHRKFGKRGRHSGLNTWLYLVQSGLDPATDQVEIVEEERVELTEETKQLNRKNFFEMLADKDIDACFMAEPKTEFARRAGFKVIDIPPQPMVLGMTVSSSLKLVKERPELVERMLKGVLEGIAYFKQNREESIKILIDRFDKEGKLDRAGAEIVYDQLAPTLEPKLYPGMDAIANVYLEALEQDKAHGDAKRIHPLALWDFHFLRELDDAGFINDLYKNNPALLEGHGG